MVSICIRSSFHAPPIPATFSNLNCDVRSLHGMTFSKLMKSQAILIQFAWLLTCRQVSKQG
jgi:hypothetical protein